MQVIKQKQLGFPSLFCSCCWPHCAQLLAVMGLVEGGGVASVHAAHIMLWMYTQSRAGVVIYKAAVRLFSDLVNMQSVVLSELRPHPVRTSLVWRDYFLVFACNLDMI